VLEEVLGEDSGQLSHLLEALDAGGPPHAGIALGTSPPGCADPEAGLKGLSHEIDFKNLNKNLQN
jgi:hypothetical protein